MSMNSQDKDISPDISPKPSSSPLTGRPANYLPAPPVPGQAGAELSDDSRALLEAWREDERKEQQSMADFHAGKWGKYGPDGKKIEQPPVQVTINITSGQPPEVK